MKCDYCNQDIQPDPITGWAGGNNGWPLEKNGVPCDTVCNMCNDLVVMERLKKTFRRQPTAWGVKEEGGQA